VVFGVFLRSPLKFRLNLCEKGPKTTKPPTGREMRWPKNTFIKRPPRSPPTGPQKAHFSYIVKRPFSDAFSCVFFSINDMREKPHFLKKNFFFRNPRKSRFSPCVDTGPKTPDFPEIWKFRENLSGIFPALFHPLF